MLLLTFAWFVSIIAALAISKGRTLEIRALDRRLRLIDGPPTKPRVAAPDLRPLPTRYMRGAWNNCQLCGRRLTDPMSRTRGTGPDCYARTGIAYWDGPERPDFINLTHRVQEYNRMETRRVAAHNVAEEQRYRVAQSAWLVNPRREAYEELERQWQKATTVRTLSRLAAALVTLGFAAMAGVNLFESLVG